MEKIEASHVGVDFTIFFTFTVTLNSSNWKRLKMAQASTREQRWRGYLGLGHQVRVRSDGGCYPERRGHVARAAVLSQLHGGHLLEGISEGRLADYQGSLHAIWF